MEVRSIVPPYSLTMAAFCAAKSTNTVLKKNMSNIISIPKFPCLHKCVAFQTIILHEFNS
eukprot:scaffold4467_cov170-Skeletonema_marinoi.AAC.7